MKEANQEDHKKMVQNIQILKDGLEDMMYENQFLEKFNSKLDVVNSNNKEILSILEDQFAGLVDENIKLASQKNSVKNELKTIKEVKEPMSGRKVHIPSKFKLLKNNA